MSQISVIVPVYKVEPYLHRCIDSILGQTFTDFTLILVDDGSPDRCGEICDEYARKDSRIVVIHQENQGLSAARNAGIDWAFANSDSEWITFIDSDDWVHPMYLEALKNGADQSGLDVVVGGYEKTAGSNPRVDVDKLTMTVYNSEVFFCEKSIIATVAWAKLYRKELFKTIRYPIGKIHEDEYITYRIIFQQPSLAYVAEPIYAYYINENGIMQSKWTLKRLDALAAFEGQIDFFLRHAYSNALLHAANHYAEHLVYAIYQLKHNFPNEKRVLNECRHRARKMIRNKKYANLIAPELIRTARKESYPGVHAVCKYVRKKRHSARVILKRMFK